jgi:hypothetical protein
MECKGLEKPLILTLFQIMAGDRTIPQFGCIINMKWKETEINGIEVSDTGLLRKKGVICKTQKSHASGYENITAWINDKVKSFYVHRLVAKAFVPNPNNYPQVDHIDNNKFNNQADNLRWVTCQTNILRTSKPIKASNKETGEVKIFLNSRLAQEELGGSRRNISNSAKKNYMHKGWRLEWIEVDPDKFIGNLK